MSKFFVDLTIAFRNLVQHRGARCSSAPPSPP